MSDQQFRKYKETEFVNLFIEFAKLLRPNHYLEIGIKKGYVFKEMVKYCGHAVGVDPNPLLHEDFLRHYENATVFKMTSEEFKKTYQGPKFDMIFIDGDHTLKGVLHDVVEIAKPMIKPTTGLIFIHDTYPSNPDLTKPGYCDEGGWQVARAIHKDFTTSFKDFEIVTIPGPWAGVSILRYVPEEHLHWQKGTMTSGTTK